MPDTRVRWFELLRLLTNAEIPAGQDDPRDWGEDPAAIARRTAARTTIAVVSEQRVVRSSLTPWH